MCRRRILYGLALIAALLFQIFYDRYLARYVLAGVVSIPILSLLLALPGALGLRLELTGEGAEAPRGDAGQWRLRVARPRFWPVSRLDLRLELGNDLTGWTRRERLTEAGPGAEERQIPVQADHCGRATCRVTRARALDCMGLFAIPVRLPPPAVLLVLPVAVPEAELPAVELPEAPEAPAGNSLVPNGDYELRDYRAGDPLRSIHWKLSSKRDELVVREWRGENRPRVVLAVDRFGTPEELDRVLDRLYTLSVGLLDRDCPHMVRWQAEGTLRSAAVADRGTLLDCLNELLSSPAPLTGTPMGELLPEEQGVPTVYVTSGEEETP